MPKQHTPSPTCFVFSITEMESYPDGTTPLSQHDLKGLMQVARRALALSAFSPANVDPLILLAGPKLIVRMVMSPSAPASMVPGDVHTLCTDALTTLNRSAAELKRNAKQGKPLPIKAVAPDKNIVNLLRALASDDEEFTSPVTFESQGSEQLLPVLTPADFTAAGDETAQRQTGTFRIVGLIRGDKSHAHQLVLAGGVRIDLPTTAYWSWANVHDVLDYETTITGTLARDSISNPWSISKDSKIVRSPPLF